MSEHLIKLRNLQSENAQLYARLAELKKVSNEDKKHSDDEVDEDKVEYELESTLRKNSDLQNELAQLKSQKDTLQAKYEQLTLEYHKVTLAKIKQEEGDTHKFHDSILEIICKHDDIDYKTISNLLSIAEEHRKRTVELKNEYEKLNGFIKLQKYQNSGEPKPLPIPHHHHQNRASLGTDIPLCINGIPPSIPNRRRRVSIAKIGSKSESLQ